MTYSITYQDEGSLFFKTHTVVGCATDEDAAWEGKIFCDSYGYKLIDVRKLDEA